MEQYQKNIKGAEYRATAKTRVEISGTDAHGNVATIRKTKKGRRYYGCEDNPECEFMSWQKPSREKCPECGGYMVEKGNKLVCANEKCGYVTSLDKKKE